MAAELTAGDIAYVTALVRAHERPRYYAALFAPAAVRTDLFALYGFAAEVACVPDLVSDPTLGEIRLRWWQESLADAVAAGGGSTPALRAVAVAIIRHKLPLAPFEALVEARSADLYSDPPATLADVEGRMGETESALFQMAAIILGASGPETAEAAGHAGIAYGVARRLGCLASERVRGRTILPADLLERHALAPADLFREPPNEVERAVSEMAALARSHLDDARAAIATLRARLRVAFLPLAVVPALLKRVERLGPEIVRREAAAPDLEALVRIGLARFWGFGGGFRK